MVSHIPLGHLTEEGRWKVVYCMQELNDAKAVARRLNTSKITVLKWWKVYKKHGTVNVSRNRSGKLGRPIKWNGGVNADLKKLLETHDVCFTSEIQQLGWKRLSNVPTRTLNYILRHNLGTSIKKKIFIYIFKQ